MILEVQDRLGMGTAKRLALAIDREYARQVPRDMESYKAFVKCICKTCSRVFYRNPSYNLSRDYCKPTCHPKSQATRHLPSKLTRKEVDEIRKAYETSPIKVRVLAEKYGVSRDIIRNIVNYKTWNSDSYSNRASRLAKLTWEQVDEIRNLYATEKISFRKIGRIYGIDHMGIANIVHHKAWKPEHDPRRKESEAQDA
jgi:hypothetical protein